VFTAEYRSESTSKSRSSGRDGGQEQLSLGIATRALERLDSRDCTNKPHYWTALSKVRVGRDSRAKTTDE